MHLREDFAGRPVAEASAAGMGNQSRVLPSWFMSSRIRDAPSSAARRFC